MLVHHHGEGSFGGPQLLGGANVQVGEQDGGTTVPLGIEEQESQGGEGLKGHLNTYMRRKSPRWYSCMSSIKLTTHTPMPASWGR